METQTERKTKATEASITFHTMIEKLRGGESFYICPEKGKDPNVAAMSFKRGVKVSQKKFFSPVDERPMWKITILDNSQIIKKVNDEE